MSAVIRADGIQALTRSGDGKIVAGASLLQGPGPAEEPSSFAVQQPMAPQWAPWRLSGKLPRANFALLSEPLPCRRSSHRPPWQTSKKRWPQVPQAGDPSLVEGQACSPLDSPRPSTWPHSLARGLPANSCNQGPAR